VRHCVRDCQVSLSCALRDELRKGRVLFLPPCMSCIGMMRMFMMEKKSTYELGKKMQADALYRDKRRLVKSDCCRTVSGLAR
jgi:hypothetical protein